jgi:D-sedoheptulose 7-phosphate isomerase
MQDLVNHLFGEHKKVTALTHTQCAADVCKAADICLHALQKGHRIWLFGNGGSAADALHLAAEFTGRYQLDRKGLPAVALTSDPAALTSIGNDFGFDMVFSRQVEALCSPGDVCIGLSTSGTSKNVLHGLEKARILGAKTIGFTGKNGGTMPDLCDVCLLVPAQVTSRIQEMHLLLGHTLVELIETSLFPSEKAKD